MNISHIPFFPSAYSICEKQNGKYKVECVTDPNTRYSRPFSDLYANKKGLLELGICVNNTFQGFESYGMGQVGLDAPDAGGHACSLKLAGTTYGVLVLKLFFFLSFCQSFDELEFFCNSESSQVPMLSAIGR